MTDKEPEKREQEEIERLRKLLGDTDEPEPADEPQFSVPEIQETEFPEPPTQEEIDRRLRAARGDEDRDWREAKPKVEGPAADRAAASGLASGLSIAYTLVGWPVAGIFFGWLIESQTGAKGWQGGLTVLGAFIGVLLAIRIINRSQGSR